MYDVGIVVPTRGSRLLWLVECLGSIRSQSDVSVRIIVVAPPNTEVEKLAVAYGAEYLVERHAGLSSAINQGLATLTDCEAIGWLGDDDTLTKGSLSFSMSKLCEVPQAAATYGRVRYVDEDGRTLFSFHPRAFSARYLGIGKDLVPQPGSLFRASAMSSVGDLDPSLRFAMDLDIFLRLRRVGRLAYVRKEVATFRLHGGSITGTNTSYGEAERVRARHRGFAERVVVLALRFATPTFDRILHISMRRPLFARLATAQRANAERPRVPLFADWSVNRGRPRTQVFLFSLRLAQRFAGHYTCITSRLVRIPAVLPYRLLAAWVVPYEIPYQARIGPRLSLAHGFGIVINARAQLGSDVTLRHGVTIGNVVANGPCPVVNDRVNVGAGAMILGGISVGAGAVVGAGAIVLADVPAGSTVVGAPARVVARKEQQ